MTLGTRWVGVGEGENLGTLLQAFRHAGIEPFIFPVGDMLDRTNLAFTQSPLTEYDRRRLEYLTVKTLEDSRCPRCSHPAMMHNDERGCTDTATYPNSFSDGPLTRECLCHFNMEQASGGG